MSMTVCTFFALATLLLSMGLDMFYSALPNFYMGLAFSGNCGRTFFSFSPSTTETETDDELKK